MEGMGRGWGQTDVGDSNRVSDTWFAVTEGVGDVNTSACCIVSSLESKPLIPRRSQLTSSRSP